MPTGKGGVVSQALLVQQRRATVKRPRRDRGLFFIWKLARLGPSSRKKESGMPLRTFLTLLVVVVASAGLTILLAYYFDVSFIWLGLAAILAAVAVRRWM